MALQTTFEDYMAILADDEECGGSEDGRLYIMRDRVHRIRGMAERCERTSKFRRLVKETKAAYAKRPDREGYDIWQTSVEHVLRRSRIYADVFNSDYCPKDLFKRFEDAFTEAGSAAIILAPLESVEFSADCPLDFGSFQITKFSREELSTITENDTRALFYAESVLDIGLLSRYWWLSVPYVPEPTYPGQEFRINLYRAPIERQFSTFPPPVERILKTLILYDWDANSSADRSNKSRYDLLEDSRGWLGFHLPFVLRCGGSLFGPAVQTPDISRLALEPFFSDDGEEIGERPRQPIHYLCPKQTSGFCRIVAGFDNQLKTIRTQTDEWRFIDVAVSHLVKSFFAFELDQLLWHMVAIEALLGERESGLTDTLVRRCGSVLGCTNDERAKIGKSFRKIYELRSDVVHGNTKLGNTQNGHLSVARFIARDVTVWFLKYLCHIAEGIPPNDKCLPHRRELLSALDTKPVERNRISHLFTHVPIDFPGKKCWDEP